MHPYDYATPGMTFIGCMYPAKAIEKCIEKCFKPGKHAQPYHLKANKIH